MQQQGVKDMPLVVVAHPIAGHNLDGIKKKADGMFADVMNAATQWQPK